MPEKTDSQYALGLDYGTNSTRAVVVDVSDGREVSSHVFEYPTGESGIILDRFDPNVARQNPMDYLDGLFVCIPKALKSAGKKDKNFDPARVIGLGVDTTGSTPIPVDAKGIPLSRRKAFQKDPAAYAWLWKDHTGFAEAAEITQKALDLRPHYLGKCGRTYSSEWFWSKILHCKRTAPKVFASAYSWVEAADFIPAYLTGNLNPRTMARGICPAGHKAMYHDGWGGLPDKEFLAAVDPALSDLRDRLYDKAVPSDRRAGGLSKAIAKKVGLPAGIPVSVGTFDAHAGGVGAGIRPGVLVKILGTSACDMMICPMDRELADIPGLCGMVPGSIVPGYVGLEAGQSAVGDIFNWFVNSLGKGRYGSTAKTHDALTAGAGKLAPGGSGLLALDWNNGNRTVLVDPLLTGLLVGQTLHTTPAEIYRALIESTAFGALTIINRFEEYGVNVESVITCGGIAEKNPLVMQIYADVTGRTMKVSRSGQTCALGAAVYAAVAAGGYPTVPEAQAQMTGTRERDYTSDASAHAVYQDLYGLYKILHNAFGIRQWQGNLFEVMKRLIQIRRQALSRSE